ncbi:hypothetical protein [Geminisphaera colitermitum]|uniref:hypothetical protein n=1 Tax=Geminisphaera colitermitum TaxID=1148786 RepID=UPI00031D033E|nr:hypothetical protein [Geminisphaera colitermitum]
MSTTKKPLPIKIIVADQPQNDPCLTHEHNGRQYLFLWDKSLKAYAYQPKSPEEIRTIFTVPRQLCPWTFIPVLLIADIHDIAPDILAEKLAEIAELSGKLEVATASLSEATATLEAANARITSLETDLQNARDEVARASRPPEAAPPPPPDEAPPPPKRGRRATVPPAPADPPTEIADI